MKKIRAKQALLKNGWARDVLISVNSDGLIAIVERGQAKAIADEERDILLPAPVNLHSHAFQRAMAGLTEARGGPAGDSFWTWRRLMYQFLDRLTPEDIESIAGFVQLEMLEAGYAGVAEFHYIHHGQGGRPYDNLAELSDRIFTAQNASGIGLTHLPVLYEQGGCDGRKLVHGQDRFGNDVVRFSDLFDRAAKGVKQLPPDCQIGVAPHSLRAVKPSSLTHAVQMAPDAPLHMHLAEQVAEVEEVEAAYGARPVDWLLQNYDVDKRWCLIHCTQMTDDETDGLANSGAVAGLCPITESSLGDGIFNGMNFQRAGGKFGIGSDSNVRISLSEELRTLEYSQRLKHRNRAALATEDHSTGRYVFEGACHGGAQAAGRNSGSIEEGKYADLIALDSQSEALVDLEGDMILDAFVFAGDDRLVTDTWSAGRHVVQEGWHINSETIRRRYFETIRKLRDDV